MVFVAGQDVMAKWPGTSLYYKAVVNSIDEEDDSANLLYIDGSVMDVPLSFVKSENAFRKRRSPSRRRSRSPGRSPARKAKDVSAVDGDESTKSNGRILTVKISSMDGGSSNNEENTKKEVKLRKGELKPDIDGEKADDDSDDTVNNKEQTSARETAKLLLARPRSSQQNLGYGGIAGTFVLYFACPAFFLQLAYMISRQEYSLGVDKFNATTSINAIWNGLDVEAMEIIGAFALFNAVIYAIPFGYLKKGPTTPSGLTLHYRISAMYTLVLTLATFLAMFYYGDVIPISLTICCDKYFELAVTSTAISFVACALMYIKSFFVSDNELNPAAQTGSAIYDSFTGRELHPRIGKYFDLKMYLYRYSMGGWIVVVLAELQKVYENDPNKFSSQTAIIVLAVSQIVYCVLEFFWNEEACMYMFDIKNEGLGFVQTFGEMMIVPFVYTVPLKYLASHANLHVPTVRLLSSVLLFVVGIVLIVGSTVQKTEFRKNPYNPKLARLESLPATKQGGDRILVSGFWGIVRHPNYLGEIFIAFAWSLLCGYEHLVVWFYPVFVIGLLCDRAHRVEHESEMKHGHTWSVYCHRVRYKVIPLVF